jgi:hypothetical protein
MAFGEGARNNHVVANHCCGLMHVQQRSKVKGLGSFASAVEVWRALLQQCSFVTCAKGRTGSSLRIGTGETRYYLFLKGW